jgi:hypothetical protein
MVEKRKSGYISIFISISAVMCVIVTVVVEVNLLAVFTLFGFINDDSDSVTNQQ